VTGACPSATPFHPATSPHLPLYSPASLPPALHTPRATLRLPLTCLYHRRLPHLLPALPTPRTTPLPRPTPPWPVITRFIFLGVRGPALRACLDFGGVRALDLCVWPLPAPHQQRNLPASVGHGVSGERRTAGKHCGDGASIYPAGARWPWRCCGGAGTRTSNASIPIMNMTRRRDAGTAVVTAVSRTLRAHLSRTATRFRAAPALTISIFQHSSSGRTNRATRTFPDHCLLRRLWRLLKWRTYVRSVLFAFISISLARTAPAPLPATGRGDNATLH